MSKAVFLDRDGVLNREVDYLSDPSDVELYDGVVEGLSRIIDAGFKLVVISNQSGVSRGLISEEVLSAITDRLKDLLGEYGIILDGVYYCMHHPDEGCACRKPATGLFDDAVHDLGISLTESFMVGDKTVDIKAGVNAGVKTVLVKTGYAGKDGLYKAEPDYIAEDLEDAARWIINQE